MQPQREVDTSAQACFCNGSNIFLLYSSCHIDFCSRLVMVVMLVGKHDGGGAPVVHRDVITAD